MLTTFVINLDKDKERLAFMHGQLTACGMTYRRQQGVLGKEYTPTPAEYDDVAAIKATGRALIPGEIGCALSHVAVYKTIVAESIPFALVFEDDVLIPHNFKDIVERMVKQQPLTNFDYLLFDYVPVGIPYLRQWFAGVLWNVKSRSSQSLMRAVVVLLYACIKIWYILPLSLFEGWRDSYMKQRPGPAKFYRPVYFAGAYLLTLEGAKKLLSLSEPVVYTADQLPNKARVLRGLNFFCYAPRSVEQLKRTFGSSILDKSGAEIV